MGSYPWPSTVNIANFVTVKPSVKEEESSNNFNIWKEQMLCLVESQDVLSFINGESLPPIGESEQKLWRRTDRLVKGWILGSIGNDVLGTVCKLDTAREVWLQLENIFNLKAVDSELQPQSDANADQKTAAVANAELFRHLPLYKAALRGDWETAKTFLTKNDKDSAPSVISYASETALHVAVTTGKANDFVKKLVGFLQSDALALKDIFGDTALHHATMVGNKEAAMVLLNKNPDLLYILNDKKQLPIQTAVVYGHKDTLEYLISKYDLNPNVELSPLQGQLGIGLLTETIAAKFLDVALDLVKKYPDLARLKCGLEDGYSALETIAIMDSVFLSGESFCWWQKKIYHRIPLKQAEQKAATDIENARSDAPVQIITRVAKKFESMIWKFVEHIVPHVKNIRKKKEKHQQALELVNFLCQQMLYMPENEVFQMFHHSIINAATHGISEIVEVIMEIYPLASFAADATGKNVFLLAANNRFENVFNLIYKMGDRKYRLSYIPDIQDNNLMHICAKLAPSKRLNLVPGAALQMQRELQWMKEMEKFVCPARRILLNSEGKTPKMIFTEEHQLLKAEGEKWMKDTSNACTIATALIATVVFAAAFTVPGGVVSETGIPVLSNQSAFILFAVSDAVALFTSITSLLMFLSILTSRYAEEDFLYVLPKRLSIGLLSLFVSITFLMVAFSATLYLVFQGKVGRFVLPVVTLACLPVTSFVLLQFPLLVDVVYSTYGPGIFGKKSDRLLY